MTHPKVSVQCTILHVFSHNHCMFNCTRAYKKNNHWSSQSGAIRHFNSTNTLKKRQLGANRPKTSEKYLNGSKTHRNPYIWWPLPPDEWCSGERTAPWWRPRSKNPASASPCSPASASWSPPPPLSSRPPSEYHGTPHRTRLQRNNRSGINWLLISERETSERHVWYVFVGF